MKKALRFSNAEKAASEFFKTNFNHSGEVGYCEYSENVLEFYSKDDPAMDETFTVLLQGCRSWTLETNHLSKMDMTDDEVLEILDNTFIREYIETPEGKPDLHKTAERILADHVLFNGEHYLNIRFL